MRYSTGPRRRSRLQGHRRRRRQIEVEKSGSADSFGWTEYKTCRQYPSVGELLDEVSIHGHTYQVDDVVNGPGAGQRNGFTWISAEDDDGYDEPSLDDDIGF